MPSETSLVRQLRKLSVPQTTLLLQGKFRPSLLFDHRDASSLGCDAFFAYGTNGLDKLQIMSPVFEKFRENLFSENSKTFERSVQVESVNEKLNRRIEEFLAMVSPYFLFRATQEALEWLIYRYHIHLFNVDALIASALPYYHTQTFVRVIQLFSFRDKSSQWDWLVNVKNSGEPLQSNALFNHFNIDESFRVFVCNIAPNILKVYEECDASVTQPIVSFSMLTAYFALGKLDNISENMISSLLPFIVKALNSKLSFYKASAYLVISKIVTKVQLSEAVAKHLLSKLSQNLTTELLKESLELILLIVQLQENFILQRKVVSLLWNLRNVVDFLQYLVNSYDCSRFMRNVIKHSIIAFFIAKRRNNTESEEKIRKFLQNIFDVMKLDEKIIIMCFRITMKQHTKSLIKFNNNKKALQNVSKCGQFVLKNLETKWPSYFDKAVTLFFKKKNKHCNKLMEFVNRSVSHIEHMLLPKTKQMIAVSMNHVNPSIRENTIKSLLHRIQGKKIYEAKFVENALMQCLTDDNPNVVAAVLLAPEILTKFLSRKSLLKGIDFILTRKIKIDSPWYPLQLQSLNFFAKFNNNQELEGIFDDFVTLLPFIFPLTQESIKGFKLILNSFGDAEGIIQTLRVDISSSLLSVSESDSSNLSVLNDINCAIILSIQNYLESLNRELKSAFLSVLMNKINQKESSIALNVIYLLTLDSIFDCHAQNSKSIKATFLQLENYFSQDFIMNDIFYEDMSQESVIKSFIKSGKLPASIIFFVLSKIIKKFQLKKEDFIQMWWPCNENLNSEVFFLLKEIFEFLLTHINIQKQTLLKNFKKLFAIFVKCQFSDVKDLFWFLSYFWSNTSDSTSIMQQVASINIARKFCREPNVLKFFFTCKHQFLPSLINAMSSPTNEVRFAAITMLSQIVNVSDNFDHAFEKFCLELVCHSEEIMIDFRCFNEVVRNWLRSSYESLDIILSSPQIVNNDCPQVEVLKSFLDLILEQSTPCAIRCSVLLLLQEADSPMLLSAVLPLLRYYIDKYKSKVHHSRNICSIIQSLLLKYSPKSVKSITDDNCEEAKVLLECLQLAPIEMSSLGGSVQVMTLQLMTKDLFFAIPSVTLQHKILNLLADLFISSGSSEVNEVVSKTLKKLCISASILLNIFQEPMISKPMTTLKEVRRTINQETNSVKLQKFDKKMWQRITVILEIIQNKTKIKERKLLIPELFTLLNKTLDFESDSSVEYLRQLILSTIYNCCQELGIGGLDEGQFQVELIVHCIRSSSNPKTHHQSLLLLNLAATMFPDYVLSNVMSIFTFMGTSLIRQDDSYSFQVISQTIETIVPAFLEASNLQKDSDENETVASVIRVFVDSLTDIPRHRQLPLFTKLVSTLDSAKYLWIPLVQICDHYTTAYQKFSLEDQKNWELSASLEFATTLHKQFSPAVQIETINKLLGFIATLPNSKKALETSTTFSKFKELFDLANHSDEQIKIFKLNILSYINAWLSSSTFLNQLSDLDLKAQSNLEEKYETLLEIVLGFLQNQLEEDAANLLLPAKKKHTLVNLLYNLISNVNLLLPCKLFTRVVKRLLHNPVPAVQQKSMELLNSKLEQKQFLSEDDEIVLLKLIKPLLKIVKNDIFDPSNSDQNILMNHQTALFSLHLLTKVMGMKYPEKFRKVLSLTISILSNEMFKSDLIVSTLLCLSQLCKCLSIHVLPFLNMFVPKIIKLLEKDFNSSGFDHIVLGVLAALESLIENLGAFMSSYMEDLLTNICILSVKYNEKKGTVLIEKLSTVKKNIAQGIAGRVLLPALENSYEKLIQKDKMAIAPLMEIISEKLTITEFTDVKPLFSKLQHFFLKLLDFRYIYYSTDICDNVYAIEEKIISTLIAFVLKLSETDFRNFFQAILLWATSREEKHRTFTFYRLTCTLSMNLKNIFSIFAKYFIKHAASVLDSNNTAKSNNSKFDYEPAILNSQLLNFVLDTLKYCFQYDDGHILDKTLFQILLHPLADQIENQQGTDSDFKTRVENSLSVCIGNFMAAVTDQKLWKAFNNEIMLKTRHSMPSVRFASLQVIREVVTKMGDGYLVLLPESIPFLAEMMEDESSEVEDECRSIITDMEKILGEPLKNYF